MKQQQIENEQKDLNIEKQLSKQEEKQAQDITEKAVMDLIKADLEEENGDNAN